MAKESKKAKKGAEQPKIERLQEFLGNRLAKEIFGVFLIAFTLFLVAGLVSYSSLDLGNYRSGGIPLLNLGGIVGAYLSSILIKILGGASYVVPVVVLACGILLFRQNSWNYASSLIAGAVLFTFSYCILRHLFWVVDPRHPSVSAGGFLGKVFAENIFIPLLARPGTALVGFTVLFLSLLVATRVSVSGFWQFLKRSLADSLKLIETTGKSLMEKLSKFKEHRPVIGRSEDEQAVSGAEEPKETEIASEKMAEKELLPEIVKNPERSGHSTIEEFDAEQATFTFDEDGQAYSLPQVSFLNSPKHVSRESTEKELLVNSQILVKKLSDFGIEGRVTMVLPGPVITLYEFEPAAGIKVSRIVGLADDLAMGLRAISVRILAPVPGKAVVGIEVPNKNVDPVSLKKIIASEEFKESGSKLTMVLGKDTSGIPVVTDLAVIPHLLVAGATGSGKSVGLNTMIMSILYKSTPAEVKFIMIDPKMLELSVYDGIPHLIAPVVTNPKKAANALKWAVTEMDRRYHLLADMGFRNIASYNKWVKEYLEEKEAEKEHAPIDVGDSEMADKRDGDEADENEKRDLKPLPYIVVVIDELADLMMVASKDVEDALARIAQMARAAGIHLIVATQRPSVDVLTGVIKANFPARISYQVTSRIDSRTILDSIGAEKLLGKGDMLFLPPGTSRLRRIHGPFVADEEIKTTVDFFKKQGKPVYNEEILKAHARAEESAAAQEDDDDDEYFEQAVDIISNTRQASISMIQRRLRIGYNRAARIIETMEAKGMVGPADGAKPRQVLIPDRSDSGEI